MESAPRGYSTCIPVVLRDIAGRAGAIALQMGSLLGVCWFGFEYAVIVPPLSGYVRTVSRVVRWSIAFFKKSLCPKKKANRIHQSTPSGSH